MGRFIPVKRPDGSEVASEQGVSNLGGGKSLADIVTSLGSKTLANIFDAVTDLKGTSSKTLTDVVASLGSKTLADVWQAVSDLKGGGSKTLTDIVTAMAGLPAVRGATTSANSLSVTPATDSVFPIAGMPRTYTDVFNGPLTSTYQIVATTTTATKSLRMSAACNASAYDIEYQVVTAGAATPTTTGQALLAGEDFLAGIPVGDIYARSATAQKLIVWRG